MSKRFLIHLKCALRKPFPITRGWIDMVLDSYLPTVRANKNRIDALEERISRLEERVSENAAATAEHIAALLDR